MYSALTFVPEVSLRVEFLEVPIADGPNEAQRERRMRDPWSHGANRLEALFVTGDEVPHVGGLLHRLARWDDALVRLEVFRTRLVRLRKSSSRYDSTSV